MMCSKLELLAYATTMIQENYHKFVLGQTLNVTSSNRITRYSVGKRRARPEPPVAVRR